MKVQTSVVLCLLVVLLMTACLPNSVPTAMPQVDVVVTVVNSEDLGDAVAAALTGTASSDVAATETALAVAGITRTPSPTPTDVPTATDPPYVAPTNTATPTATWTPSVTPYPSNTPNSTVEPVSGQIRVINAWRSNSSSPVDVFIDETMVALGLDVGGASPYLSVDGSKVVRVVLIPPAGRETDPLTNREILIPKPPVVDQLVEVPQGSSITVALVGFDVNPKALIIPEDTSPLASGTSRVAIVHANSNLFRVDVVESLQQVTVVHDLGVGESAGPFDVPSGLWSLQLVDTNVPSQVVAAADPIYLDTNLNYLIVMVRGTNFGRSDFDTDMLVFPGTTRLTPGDVPVRFVNASPNAGPLSITVQGISLVSNLKVGEATLPLPVSRQGGEMLVFGADGMRVLKGNFPEALGGSANAERIIFISDLPEEQINREQEDPNFVDMTVINREPPPSSALANIRLIHGLTGANQTLDLEIRATDPGQITNPIGIPLAAEADLTWSRVARSVGIGQASPYITRAARVFDVRVVLSSTGAVQASLERLTMLPGGAYDVVIVPGSQVGAARLLVLSPDPQVSLIGTRRGDPQVVEQIVDATLTAVAPQSTLTVAGPRTPTATISPVPTNTPRPSNTPQVQPPAVRVDPAPPNAAMRAVVVFGEHFKPNVRYTINLDQGPTIVSDRTSEEGMIAQTIDLPAGIVPGPHTVRICVDCQVNGAQQEALAAFIVADPATTPTATPQP
ncbi:MAG: DUF4397 domain-containing protein [Anaerolineae bacterium]|nr:DUF4397 domain-containing protein [Anaerolineae bacterium]